LENYDYSVHGGVNPNTIYGGFTRGTGRAKENIVHICSGGIVDAAVGGINCGGDTIVNETVHFARFFGVKIAVDVKSLYGAAKTHGQVRRVIVGDRGNAALASEDVLPSAGDAAADRADDAHAGYDDTWYGSAAGGLRHVFPAVSVTRRLSAHG